ncbi:unnamed protein product [Owenia fusiformis]|uniref:Uncharacterized protein n=1 Tax=Owenia fusiformis TaxID=6347 RepID=A0A8J1TXW4_OWEFU|nr:unnamed protein product [Owenia fusiformis]
MAASSLVEKIKDILECKLCFERSKNPRSFPCQHSFCLDCIDKLVKKLAKNNRINCPLCRYVWRIPPNGIHALRSSFLINSLMDVHTGDIDDVNLNCGTHPDQRLGLYCEDDHSLICLQCYAYNHAGHTFTEIDKAAFKYKQDIDSRIKRWEQLSAKLNDALNDLKAKEDQFRNDTEAIITHLNEKRLETETLLRDIFMGWIRGIRGAQKSEIRKKHVERDDLQLAKVVADSMVIQLKNITNDADIVKMGLELKKDERQIPSIAHPTSFGPVPFPSTPVTLTIDPKQDISTEDKIKDNDESSPDKDSTLSEQPQSCVEEQPTAVICTTFSEPILLRSKHLPLQTQYSMLHKFFRLFKSEQILDLAILKNEDIIAIRVDCVEIYSSTFMLKKMIAISKWRVTEIANDELAFTDNTNIVSIYTTDGRHKQDIATPFGMLHGIAGSKDGTLVASAFHTDAILYIDVNTGVMKTKTKLLKQESDNQIEPINDHITMDNDDNVIMSDWGNNCIKVVDMENNTVMEYEGSGDEQLSMPMSVTADKHGNVAIADYQNNRVTLVNKKGDFIRHLLTKDDGLDYPCATVINLQGHLLVGDNTGTIFEVKYLEGDEVMDTNAS